MRAKTDTRLRELSRSHELYRHYQQDPSSRQQDLVSQGHPDAAQYRELRAFYDSLKYASNAGARFYTYRDPCNCAQYFAPSLDAEDGWPPHGRTWLYAGMVILDTEVSAAAKSFEECCMQHYTPCACRPADAGQHHLLASLSSMEQLQALLHVIDLFQGAYRLPPRTIADNERDHEPLPLQCKGLMFGSVEHVTVTDHHILVPLVPFGVAGRAKLQRDIEELVALIQDGYPWNQCDEYLKQNLAPNSYRALHRKYAYPATSLALPQETEEASQPKRGLRPR